MRQVNKMSRRYKTTKTRTPYRRLSKKQKEDIRKLDKRIKCIYCKKPINIDNFAGITKKGMICGNTFCLMDLAKEFKEGGRNMKNGYIYR